MGAGAPWFIAAGLMVLGFIATKMPRGYWLQDVIYAFIILFIIGAALWIYALPRSWKERVTRLVSRRPPEVGPDDRQ